MLKLDTRRKKAGQAGGIARLALFFLAALLHNDLFNRYLFA